MKYRNYNDSPGFRADIETAQGLPERDQRQARA